MSQSQTNIPQGSLILVTGATGFVASHVVKQFLERGYKVRGTVRSPVKASWLIDHAFKGYADSGKFELFTVPDLAAEHAFDDAVKGVAAIIHVASILTFDSNPHNVIPQTVDGTTSILKVALKEPSVKAFVYTSSIVATTHPDPGNDTFVKKYTYNEEAVKLAWAPPPYEPSRGSHVYKASKVAAEKAVWQFVEEQKPHFTVNSVLPAMIIGEPLSKTQVESGMNWLRSLYDSDPSLAYRMPATWVVDVKDVAVLHIAAALDPDVTNARIQAWGHASNWNELVGIMRELRPQHKFVEDFPEVSTVAPTTDLRPAIALLRKWAHQNGFRPMADTVEDNIHGIEYWRTSKQEASQTAPRY